MWLLGFPNHVHESYAEFATSGSIGLEPAGMTSVLLGTEEPTERARLATLDPVNTQWGFGTSLAPVRVDGLALVNHNIEYGGQVRFCGVDTGVDGSLTGYTVSRANTIISSSNMTGALSGIDEDIYSPDGLVMAPTVTTSGWTVTLKWPTLSGTINTAADMFALVIRAKLVHGSAAPGVTPTVPRVTVALEAPYLLLGWRAVTSTATGGQVFIFPFRRSDFSSVSDFRASFTFTAATSDTYDHAVLESVALYYETVTLSSPLFDSGWINVPGSARVSPAQPTRNVHYFPESPWEGVNGFGVAIRADQAIHDPTLTTTSSIPAAVIAREPKTFVQAGVFCAGEGLQLSVGPMVVGSPPTRVNVEEVAGTTSSGQSYGYDAWRRRVTDPIQTLVTWDELEFLRDQLAFRRGHSGAFYIALEPGVDISRQTFTGLWATLKEMSAPQWFGVGGDGELYSVTLTFEEKL